ncbi:NAD(P)/FAD-dependent oxidoreductase [Archangium violaceum]|uniref:NAD(P)/FAD-dependent oxidoreductase n=1 Tax=Archangium violaceum TaxID=83451 RepID=UPI00193AE12F|nr:NAD(P)/FAD-dependent oxidoreductase [Archangium violaceum]QRK06642.1 NAD(P)/FAD-dependent oxidoreductase [Archangium violaceum]
MWDVIVVGGGPAGLSAALMLGRACRKVLVLDSGEYRNGASHAAHGFLTRDGTPPEEIRRLAREELARYDVEVRQARAVDARRCETTFEVILDDGSRKVCRRLLLATGVVDELPRVPGIEPLYGRSVHHCPYCDGWEVRGQPLAAYGRGHEAAELALALTSWSDDVIFFTDGPSRLGEEDRLLLARHRIQVRGERVARLEGQDGLLAAVVLRNGERVLRRALFFHGPTRPRADLAERLGCLFNRKGAVKTGRLEGTNVPGLWVVGDASHDVKWVIVAAAEGAKAAMAINKSLRGETTASLVGYSRALEAVAPAALEAPLG